MLVHRKESSDRKSTSSQYHRWGFMEEWNLVRNLELMRCLDLELREEYLRHQKQQKAEATFREDPLLYVSQILEFP